MSVNSDNNRNKEGSSIILMMKPEEKTLVFFVLYLDLRIIHKLTKKSPFFLKKEALNFEIL